MPLIPKPAGTIEAKFNTLWDIVMGLITADPLQNATIHKGGIQIVDGGSVKVIDSDGHIVGIIGALPANFNRADGSPQPGLAFYREDGTLAQILGDLSPTVPPYKQALQLFDRVSNVIFADDTNGGVGIARPYLPAGVFADISAPTMTTTSAAWQPMQWADTYQQHPKLTASVLVSTDSGTTGAVRMTIGGAQIGSVLSVTSGAFAQMTIPAAVWPAGTYAFSQRVTVQLEAQRVTGTGKVGVRGLGLWGVQS